MEDWMEGGNLGVGHLSYIISNRIKLYIFPADSYIFVMKAKIMRSEQLENIIKRYQRPLLSVIYKMVHSAEASRDIAQESFIKFWNNYSDTESDQSVFRLLYRIAINLAIDHLRKIKTIELDDSLAPISYTEPDDMNELYQIIIKCTRELKPQQKAAFILRDLQGFDFEEISEILTIPVENIRSNLYLARKKIRKLLKINFEITQEFFYEV